MPTWWAEHAWLGGSRTTPAVLIVAKGDRFDAITPYVTDPPSGAVRLSGLTIPGLANVHSHAFHRALRRRTQEGPASFWTWRDVMYGVAARLDPDRYLRLARAVFVEMALAGFTAVGEFHYVHHQPGGKPYSDANQMGLAVMEAALFAGIRLTLLDTCYLEGGFGVPLEGVQLRFGDGSAEGWIERVRHLHPTDARIHIGAAVHSVRAVPPVAISQVADWAERQRWLLRAHVSEQRREQTECRRHRGTTPLGVLAAVGAVGPQFTAVHGTHMSRKDVVGLGAAQGSCCVCPTTERDLGDGIGPVAQLYASGVPLSIGSDSHAVIDGLEEARAMELDGRLIAEERGILDASALLEAATTNGMRALGFDSGVLAAGKLADFVTLRLDSPRTAGADPSLISTAVFAASAADVSTVVVGGRPVVMHGSHLALPDVGGELAASITELLMTPTSLAITGIGLLVTCDPNHGEGPLGAVANGALVLEGEHVIYAGVEVAAPLDVDKRVDVDGRCVMPGFVDSHTHLVFAGDRAEEFTQRMAGRPYRPAGILDTVAATRSADVGELTARTTRLVEQALAMGTTTIEIKTGYGLTPRHEAAHLVIARSLTPEVTFLGAHLVPPEYGNDRAGYLQLLIDTMLPEAPARARWCDVFCEAGAFDVEESRAVLEAALRCGLGLRVHANQLGPSGGVRLACELGAASADHCTHLTAADIDDLAASGTVATLLPISDFCTRQPYANGRALLDAGATVALASNCNPGSSFSTSVPLALALAARGAGLTIDEALLAATRGGAAALRRRDIGYLTPGARADAIVLDAPHPHHLVYRLGTSLVSGVLVAGEWARTLP